MDNSTTDFYAIGVGGSTPSPYSTIRDGFISYRSYRVDYARNQLRYRLPYLNPLYCYFLETTFYHEGHGKFQQQFILDDSVIGTVSADSGRTEVSRFDIPPGFYRDAQVLLAITRQQGERTALAQLRLVQYELTKSPNRGGQSSGTSDAPQFLELYPNSPNPFAIATTISHELPHAASVSLKVFDMWGKGVRTLASPSDGIQRLGLHNVSWDGRDDHSRVLPSGIYF